MLFVGWERDALEFGARACPCRGGCAFECEGCVEGCVGEEELAGGWECAEEGGGCDELRPPLVPFIPPLPPFDSVADKLDGDFEALA